MIFGQDDSSSSSDEENGDENLFGQKGGIGGEMIMMPTSKFIFYILILLFL
jgi:hypothetical protein